MEGLQLTYGPNANKQRCLRIDPKSMFSLHVYDNNSHAPEPQTPAYLCFSTPYLPPPQKQQARARVREAIAKREAHREKVRAAIKIQCLVRCRIAREELSHRFAEWDKREQQWLEEEAAATTIQRVFRGWYTREELAHEAEQAAIEKQLAQRRAIIAAAEAEKRNGWRKRSVVAERNLGQDRRLSVVAL